MGVSIFCSSSRVTVNTKSRAGPPNMAWTPHPWSEKKQKKKHQRTNMEPTFGGSEDFLLGDFSVPWLPKTDMEPEHHVLFEVESHLPNLHCIWVPGDPFLLRPMIPKATIPTRWAPTTYRWSYKPFPWPKINGKLGIFHPSYRGPHNPIDNWWWGPPSISSKILLSVLGFGHAAGAGVWSTALNLGLQNPSHPCVVYLPTWNP